MMLCVFNVVFVSFTMGIGLAFNVDLEELSHIEEDPCETISPLLVTDEESIKEEWVCEKMWRFYKSRIVSSCEEHGSE